MTGASAEFLPAIKTKARTVVVVVGKGEKSLVIVAPWV